MRRIRSLSVLFLIGLLMVPSLAQAADCYFLIGYGWGTYDRSFTEKFEDQILNKGSLQGGYTIDTRSHPYQLGGGCSVHRFVAVEMDYFQGLKTKVSTTANFCVGMNSGRRCSDTKTLRRIDSLEGWEITVLGKLPVTQTLSLTGRFGVLTGRARAVVTSSLYDDSVGVSYEERGTIPLLGIGILSQLSETFSLALEHKRFDGHSSITQIVARFRF